MSNLTPRIKIKIQNEDFDVSDEIKILHQNNTGAIVNFIGVVRGYDEKKNQIINSMTLEHYPGMTESEIEKIVFESSQRWELTGVTVIHRVGNLKPSDQIVFVGVSSKHRQNAFDGCNFIMDWLKTKAPFWKVEESNNKKNWVSFNENDNQAAIDTIKDGSTYSLGTVFETTYAGFDQDRIYRWGYLAVRFMFERHRDELNLMLASTRTGDWAGYKARINTWAANYANEFTQWTQDLASGGDTNPPSNTAPIAVINGPYSGEEGELIAFTSNGSTDNESTIASYSWNFGDGTTSSEANPTHSYTTAGEYAVTLTVTDPEGLSSSEATTATVTGSEPPVGNELQNGVAQQVTGNTGDEKRFVVNVPANASDLEITLNGGSGDGDLYVKFGDAPTLTSYDCRPYVGGNSERCTIEQPQAGTYHVMVYGYANFDTQVKANYTVQTGGGFNVPNACATEGPSGGGRLYDGDVMCLAEQEPIWLSIADVSGATSVAITTSNGSGDINLEYRNGGWPSAGNVDASSQNVGNGECIYITNQSEYWGYVKVSGTANGASIVVDFNTPGCR